MRLISDLVYFCKNVDLPLLPPSPASAKAFNRRGVKVQNCLPLSSPIPAVNATSRGEGVGKPSPCMLLAGAPPWEWGDQGYRQPQWLLGDAARAGGAGRCGRRTLYVPIINPLALTVYSGLFVSLRQDWGVGWCAAEAAKRSPRLDLSTGTGSFQDLRTYSSTNRLHSLCIILK